MGKKIIKSIKDHNSEVSQRPVFKCMIAARSHKMFNKVYYITRFTFAFTEDPCRLYWILSGYGNLGGRKGNTMSYQAGMFNLKNAPYALFRTSALAVPRSLTAKKLIHGKINGSTSASVSWWEAWACAMSTASLPERRGWRIPSVSERLTWLCRGWHFGCSLGFHLPGL